MHCGILVRVDGCNSYSEASAIAKDFGYRHSSQGVIRNSNIPISPEKFLEILKELNYKEYYDTEYTVEELRLLLECGTDISDIIETNFLNLVFANGVFFPEKSDFITSQERSSKTIGELLNSVIRKDQEVRRIYYANSPDTITATFQNITFKDGVIILRLAIFMGYEDWDYAVEEDSWGDTRRGHGEEFLLNYHDEDIYGYGIADSDEIYMNTSSPEGYFTNIDDHTYFMILNVHI